MSEFKQLIGSSIRSIRKAKKMSQESLAASAGFGTSYIGEIERGQRNISLDTLEKIANALGVKSSDLIGVGHSQGTIDKHVALMKTRSNDEIELVHKIAIDIFKAYDR